MLISVPSRNPWLRRRPALKHQPRGLTRVTNSNDHAPIMQGHDTSPTGRHPKPRLQPPWCVLLVLAGCAQPEQQSAAAVPALPASQDATSVQVAAAPPPAPAWPD